MSAGAGQRYMSFRLATETWGVEILKVRELIGLLELTRVPGAPAFVRGVVNLRGRVIPVIDLKRKLGIDETPLHPHTVIMVVLGPQGATGLLVDEVLDVVSFEPEAISGAQAVTQGTFAAELLAGVGRHHERVVFLLNLERALTGPAPDEVRASP
ncbi:MAG: purine-binding chemotaxis protein CheW [Myxococcaceae bacterium]|nr:purine-binding chemotaxis protein CheW [Myxococcaceae bacterium]